MIYIENYCSNCGTKIRPQGKFCEGCGQKIQTIDEIKVQMKKEIEEEIKMKTRRELLTEIQTEEEQNRQNQKQPEFVIYKKGDLFYAILIIVILIFVLSIIFSFHI